ncbi:MULTISPECIES: hypothetical protein [Streptomyces]|uniref:hypothetical protein n=1 Tax=Streptomyces TaxID=1883 RepID=UPI00374E0199
MDRPLPVRRQHRQLSGWSHNLFTIQSDNWRTVVNYGLPAAVYLLIGHAVAGRVNRT